MFIFGTRPEVIKLIPIINELKSDSGFSIKLCSTGQQKDLTKQMLDFFKFKIDHELNVMTHNQTLSELTSSLLLKISSVLEDDIPDLIFVHGDTTTAFAASLAAFYKKIKIAHIEAGLRTNVKYSPFPEEMNRTLIGKIADLHYSPTELARKNLLMENIEDKKIVVTGNTGIDTLKIFANKIQNNEIQIDQNIHELLGKKNVLITFHRRENHGEDTVKFISSIKILATEYPETNFLFPVHLNPNVKKPIENELAGFNNIFLLHPLPYHHFIYLLLNSYFVISDSGGVQEESTTLGKPLLLFRDTTERPEGANCDSIKLSKEGSLLLKNARLLMDDSSFYSLMSKPSEVFGDGQASSRIKTHLKNILK